MSYRSIDVDGALVVVMMTVTAPLLDDDDLFGVSAAVMVAVMMVAMFDDDLLLHHFGVRRGRQHRRKGAHGRKRHRCDCEFTHRFVPVVYVEPDWTGEPSVCGRQFAADGGSCCLILR
jgi:hypothetical protein